MKTKLARTVKIRMEENENHLERKGEDGGGGVRRWRRRSVIE